MAAVRASIVIPTRARPDYLKVALASIAPQAARADAEVIVVDDAGPTSDGRRLAERFGARYEPHPRPLGLNAARNTGVERSRGELIVFVDDDVEVYDGWLAAFLHGSREHPSADVFTGPVIPRLEGRPPRSCGREGPPVTSLALGPEDREARYAWGANMAIRRRAFERAGPFDTSLSDGGDEQEWQDRLRAAATDGRVLYLAKAALHHRRDAADARLRALCRTAFVRGRAARRFDARRAEAPSLARELLTLGGCLAHVLRRRCPAGLTMVAHSGGRVWEALRSLRPPGLPGLSRKSADDLLSDSFHPPRPPADDFLSGESGTVGGLNGLARATLDSGAQALEVASGRRALLDRAARRSPPRRRVLVLGVERPERRALAQTMRAELIRSRHQVELRVAAPGERGKFENLNALLGDDALLDDCQPGDRPPGDCRPPDGPRPDNAPPDCDWLLVVDDDIVLPRGFLDRFLFLVERFGFDLAQPAHLWASHAAWRVTRRRLGSVARETQFVEIGPVTAFSRRAFPILLPFPELRMGWGLDAHWAALAREHGWRCGVIDAVAIGHRAAPAASSYSREQALAEARTFLDGRAHLSAAEAQRTLAIHRRW
jgi:GT2 family glycosyltransferase